MRSQTAARPSTTKAPPLRKFGDPTTTLDGQKRASVAFKGLETLWFNTGTRCNLACENCYIESTPTNDRLQYLDTFDVSFYLDEIAQRKLPTKTVAFTGGEPFINPHIIKIISLCLEQSFEVLVLTNAYKVLKRHHAALIELNQKYPQKLQLRVSLDHYSEKIHEMERGAGTFRPTLESIKWLAENGLRPAIAGRSLTAEPLDLAQAAYQKLFTDWGIELDFNDPNKFVVFPEMDEKKEVPEITTQCFKILDVDPGGLMCANSRMVVKRKGHTRPIVLPCTLLAYDSQFELGHTLLEAQKKVYLNHPNCAQFCVLGGAKCSGSDSP